MLLFNQRKSIDLIALIWMIEKKMYNFIVFSTPPQGQNSVYRTFLDFEKTKALQVL